MLPEHVRHLEQYAALRRCNQAGQPWGSKLIVLLARTDLAPTTLRTASVLLTTAYVTLLLPRNGIEIDKPYEGKGEA
eukprot:1146329-Pelagomonas_calceolata.AAC.2